MSAQYHQHSHIRVQSDIKHYLKAKRKARSRRGVDLTCDYCDPIAESGRIPQNGNLKYVPAGRFRLDSFPDRVRLQKKFPPKPPAAVTELSDLTEDISEPAIPNHILPQIKINITQKAQQSQQSDSISVDVIHQPSTSVSRSAEMVSAPSRNDRFRPENSHTINWPEEIRNSRDFTSDIIEDKLSEDTFLIQENPRISTQIQSKPSSQNVKRNPNVYQKKPEILSKLIPKVASYPNITQPIGRVIPRVIGRKIDEKDDSLTNFSPFNKSVASAPTSVINRGSNSIKSQKLERTVIVSDDELVVLKGSETPALLNRNMGEVSSKNIDERKCMKRKGNNAPIISQTTNVSCQIPAMMSQTQYCPRIGVPSSFGYKMAGELEMPSSYNVVRNETLYDYSAEYCEENAHPEMRQTYDNNEPQIAQEHTHECKSTVDEGYEIMKKPKIFDTERAVPFKERPEIKFSTDSTVRGLVEKWPWNRPIKHLAEISFLGNKTQQRRLNLILEQSQDSRNWIKVVLIGYPRTWDRQRLLDELINWREMSQLHFTPCFVEFTLQKCKFLVNRCGAALKFLFEQGLVAHGGGYRINVCLSELAFSQRDLRLSLHGLLEGRLASLYDKNEKCVDLTAFLLQPDISMICHFPLNKVYNQRYILELNEQVNWAELTKLILASNKLTTLKGIHLRKYLPSLVELDLSDNHFASVSQLVSCQGSDVKSVVLEGNPLCHNFIHQEEYRDAVKLVFRSIVHLDGVKIRGLMEPKRHFCPNPEAVPLVQKFLDTYFDLVESKNRGLISSMYSSDAVFSLSCNSRLKKLPEYASIDMVRACRDIRLLNCVREECHVGDDIAAAIASWPPLRHDPRVATDVLHYTPSTLILVVTGSLRVLSDPRPSLCALLGFTRTFVLSSCDGTEYVINNDMLYLAEPTLEEREGALLDEKPRPALSLQLESAPDEQLKSELVDIFVKLTEMKRHECLRCLEMRNWNMRSALQYFIELSQENDLSGLSAPGVR